MGPVLPKRDESADLSLAGRAYNLAYWYSCREGAGPPMADKRVERTKGYLREALEELLREKPLERITVTEVLARAEVSKNAFYTHYGSLTALVEDCYLHRLVYFCGTNKRRGDYATREEAITETMEQRARLLYDFKRNPNLARAVLTNVGTSPYFASCEAAEEELNVDHLVTEYDTGERVADYLDDEDCAHFIASGCHGAALGPRGHGRRHRAPGEGRGLPLALVHGSHGGPPHRARVQGGHRGLAL